VKGKLSLCLTKHYVMKTYWRSGGIASPILNLGTSWRSVSASRPDRFTSGESTPGTHRIGSWVGPRAGLDAMAKRKIPIIAPAGNWTQVLQPVA